MLSWIIDSWVMGPIWWILFIGVSILLIGLIIKERRGKKDRKDRTAKKVAQWQKKRRDQ